MGNCLPCNTVFKPKQSFVVQKSTKNISVLAHGQQGIFEVNISFIDFIIDYSIFFFYCFSMRLRKRTVRTEVLEVPAEFSRFKLVKRQSTEVLLRSQDKGQISSTQQDAHKYRLRYSSQSSPKRTDANYFKSAANITNRSYEKKQRLPFQEAQNNSRTLRKSSEAASEMELLSNHLANISRKPLRNHKRTVTEPCVSLKISRTRKELLQKQPMCSKSFDKCCSIVDDIYTKIKLLKELGYADFKINEWILNYCDNRRPYMKEIFMKNISKSLYTLQEEFEFEKNSEIAKQKIRFKIQKGREMYYFIQEEELEELCKYFEEILIQKNMQKAKEVESSIVQKLSSTMVPRLKNKFFVFTKKDPIEVSNFICDLDQFEHKYGDFVNLTKVNKLRFLELNKVQHNLKATYQKMLQSQIQKIVKQAHEIQNPQI